MQFSVLGPIEVSENGENYAVGGPKQRAVLALLIANTGRPVSTGSLIEGVYGDHPPQGARRSIQTYVSNLRGEVGSDRIHGTSDGYELVAERSQIDAYRFEDTVASATADDPAQASSTLREALGIWRGHPYADVDAGDSVDFEIRRLNELRAQAIEERVEADLELGRHRDLVAELDSLTEEYPLRERFRAQQMLALYRSGRQAEALRAYEKTRNYLVEEMGLDPSTELRTLEQQILDQDPTLAFEAGPLVRRAAILVADVADPELLTTLTPSDRDEFMRRQSDALDAAVHTKGGALFAHRGSAMYASFDTIDAAVAAAASAQQSLAEIRHPMRIAIAVGEVQVPTTGSVQGPPLTRAAQLLATAHGGQVLLSTEASQALVDTGEAGWMVRSLGQHDIDGSGEMRPVYQLVVDGLPKDFAPLRTDRLPPALPVDVRGLPGYELREQIGSGAFGVVHRAYQPSVGREVAVKIIRPEFANDADFIRHFEVEAQLVARLEHPHIVPLHDYWRSPDGAFLVMRWLGGGTLRDRIERGPLSIPDVNILIEQLAPALAFAHRNGVVHCDLKPTNVLFDDEGHCYLSDFGIARLERPAGGGRVEGDIRDLAGLIAMCLHGEATGDVRRLLELATAPDSPFSDVGTYVDAWTRAIGDDPSPDHATTYTPTRNPYKGLRAFGELDADDFHGREAEVDEIVSTLREHRLVAVVGPSGIGKSSVTRAGVIPALRHGAIEGSDEWLITDMLPGPYPFEELTSALMRVSVDIPNSLEDDLRRDERGLIRSASRYLPDGQTLVLIVDQFEELFTLASADDREAFLALLAATVADDRSTVRVVLTVRADFFDRPLRFADLGNALRDGTVPIAAPSRLALADVVRLPAEGVGVRFEPGLVERIVSDVVDQPGALPLLEYALTELFDQRNHDTLTLDAYHETGGVEGALGRRAETIYETLDDDQREAVRQVFLRLVRVSDSGRETRRRVRLSELEHLEIPKETVRSVLRAYGQPRLLTFDRDATSRIPTIEVAHEALLTNWSRLAAWIIDVRQDLLHHARLAAIVDDWRTASRSDAYLLTGGRLVQHEEWTAHTDLGLTSEEQTFLRASREEALRTANVRKRRRTAVLAGFGATALVGLILAIGAMFAWRESQDQASLAQANHLATAAVDSLDSDPELALILGLMAAGNNPDLDLETRRALHAAINRNKAIASVYHESPDAWTATASISPDGTMVVGSGSARAPGRVYQVTDNGIEFAWQMDLPVEWAIEAVFSMDGDSIVAAVTWPEWDASVSETVASPPKDPTVSGLYRYDSASGTLLDRPFEDAPCINPIYDLRGFSQLPSEIVGFCRGTGIWWVLDTTSWDVVERHEEGEPLFYAVASLDGSAVQMSLMTSPLVQIVDRTTGDRFTPVFDRSLTKYSDTVLSSHGDIVAIGSNLFDATSGELIHALEADEPLTDCGILSTFSADSSLFFVGCEDGTGHVFDVASGAHIGRYEGHTAWNFLATFTSDNTTMATGAGDHTLRLWNIGHRSEVRTLAVGSGYYADAGLDTRKDVGVALVYPNETASPFHFFFSSMVRHAVGELVVFDLQTGDVRHRVPGVAGKVARISPDGSQVAVQTSTEEGVGNVTVIDLATGEPAYQLEGLCPFLPELGSGSVCEADATDLAWSPDGTHIAMAGGNAQRLYVWSIATRKLEYVDAEPLGTPGFSFSAVAYSPDGGTLAVSSKTGMWIYDTATWDLVTPFIAHTGRPSWVMKFTSDGSKLVTAQAHSGDVRIYDTETWAFDTIKGGVGQTRDLAISSDQSFVALGANDGSIHILALATGEVVELISLENRDITNIEFIDDDKHLLVSSSQGPVEVLTLDGDELLMIARSRVSRGFTTAECELYAIDPCPTQDDLRRG